MPRKIAARATLRLRAYPVVSDAVEAACLRAWRRLWKHREPGSAIDDDAAASEMHDEVMTSLSELFDWEAT